MRSVFGIIATLRRAALAVMLCWIAGAAAADASERIALVIANKSYEPAVGPLLNPHRDGELVAAALRADGFEVDLRRDLSRGQTLAAVRAHARRLADAGLNAVGFIYYAGHGASPIGSNRNYIIPVTVRDAATEALWDDSVDLDLIREILTATAPDAAQIVVFDACRNELRLPARALGDGAGRGFRPLAEDWGGMMLAFSTAPGSVAWDGDETSGNGPYAAALAGALRTAADGAMAVSAPELFAQVGASVRAARPQQTPWVALGAGRLVRFGGRAAPSPAPEAAAPVTAAPSDPVVDPRETRLYDEAVALESVALMEAFLTAYPASTLRAAAEARIAVWRAAAAPRAAPEAPAQAPETPAQAPEASEPTLGGRDLILAVQGELQRLGLYRAALDGVWGPGSRSALSRFLQRAGIPAADGPTLEILAALKDAPTPAAAASVAAEPVAAAFGEVFKECAFCPEMVGLPGGAVLMGSPTGEPGRGAEEGPQREITVAPFAIGRTEITRALYARFAEQTGHRGRRCWTFEDGRAATRAQAGWAAPGWEQAPDEPAVCVSRPDALAFLSWLNTQVDGAPYRLPSEAEWAYAARRGGAGDQGPWIWGEDPDGGCAQANGHDLSSEAANNFSWPHAACDDGYARAAPVGALAANRFGLHDLIGNVWEWTADCWTGSLRRLPADGAPFGDGDCARGVVRGGSWDDRPSYLRTARRVPLDATRRTHVVGLRVARDLPAD